MKKILALIILIASLTDCKAQDTVTITPLGNSFTFAYGNFTATYPNGYCNLVQYPDTTILQLNNPNNVFMHVGQRYYYYKNGSNGHVMTSAADFINFFNSNMIASNNVLMGQFTATPNDTTTAFRHTIPAGYTRCVITIESNIDPVRDGLIWTSSCAISDTILTANVWSNDLSGGQVKPVPATVGNININYVLGK